MKPWFVTNIRTSDRLIRGMGAAGLFTLAWWASTLAIWIGVTVALLGVFVLFEALRGWCVLRACGIRTRF
jgi:hypothetical protein